MSTASDLAAGARFDPAAFDTFRFTGRSLDAGGNVSLRYALDDTVEFEERFALPPGAGGDGATVDALLSLLHWVAGVSYYKAAATPHVACETGDPPPATAALLEALYSEGLGEFAVVNRLPRLPAPMFPRGRGVDGPGVGPSPERVLVPVGGGKD